MFSSGCSEVINYLNRTMRVREPALIFFKDTDIVFTEQNSTSYTTITLVHASMFSQLFKEVDDHINRFIYLLLRLN